MTPNMLREMNDINMMFVHSDDGWGTLFEDITFSLYGGVLGRGDVAVDCGANHGLHTRAMARACGPFGKVYSFEASPEMMALTKAQNAHIGTISYIDRAVWDVNDQTMVFNFYPNEDGLSSLRPSANTSAHVSYDVKTTTLDSAVSDPVSLIKLDIEGAEYNALRGAARIMTEDKPVIVFENGRATAAERFGYSSEDFFRMFEGRGYNLYSVSGMPLLRENWDSVMPWQFVAIHPASPRAVRAFGVMQAYVYRLKLAMT